MTQPVARIDVVRDSYFGTTIEDPYRWMEDWHSEEFQAWLRAQAEHTRAYLDALPERAGLLARISELHGASVYILGFKAAGGHVFYLKHEPQDALPKLATCPEQGGTEKLLFDPNTLAGEVHTALDWYYPSRDGRYVAYGISQGGSENSTLYVLDVESGETLDLAIERVHVGGVDWQEDNRSFFYQRFPMLASNAPVTDYYNDACMYLHRLDEDVHSDLPVFGRDINPVVEMAREDAPYLSTSALSDWVIGHIEHGDRRELTVYAVLRAQLNERETCPWQKIADIEDEVTGYAFVGDTIYLLTHKDAPRYKVLATSLKQPDLAHASVIVPESEAVVEALLAVGDSLLALDLAGGGARMRRVHVGSGEIAPVALPFDGTIREWTHDEASGEVFFEMESWLVAPRAYRYDIRSGRIEDSGLIPPSPVDVSAMEVHEVFAPAHDGTQIPLSILHKKGLALDGNNPTILEGYGSYGISLRALFHAPMLAWFERGGVYVVAHIRGGGEYGDAWHKAGYMLNKHTTIEDFIACGEYLVKQGYTRPERLVGQGGSGGGIPTGGALVRRPDLWAAMLMHVPVTNTLRFEFTENGPPNIQEFGSVTTEDGFKGLVITDSYTRIQDGVAYPAVLLTAGFNDPRVVAWQPAKMAARLQVASTSHRPVLLRVEYQGGHGFGSTRAQENELLADVLAFALEQCSLV